MNSNTPFKIVSGTRSRYLAEEIAKKYGIETYCQLPIDPDLAAAVDKGEIEFVMNDELDPIAEMLKKQAEEK